jgi:multicopper oxidase
VANNADGVPDVTQQAVASGKDFQYQYTAAQPGTYWLHPHVGVQLDRGLYAPLIVEDPHEPLSYDQDWTVVLDDWLDGIDATPDQVLKELTGGMSMGGPMGSANPSPSMSGMPMGGRTDSPSPSSSMSGSTGGRSMDGGSHMLMGSTSLLLGGDAGDVRYPYYLINGRIPAAPTTFAAKPGARVRIRFINAGGDTAFRVALGGHRMRITHTDGYPVQQVDTDALLIGTGERYDVLVTLADGVFPLVALAEGENAAGFAVVRTGSGAAPAASVLPAELNRTILTADKLQPTDSVRLAAHKPDRTVTLELGGSITRYNWTINGKAYKTNAPTPIRQGERVRLRFVNQTTMWHPMHLHGHTFALGGSAGPRKDTTTVLPGQTVNADFDADNPRLWMIHCHNVYHAEAGMMTILGYQI